MKEIFGFTGKHNSHKRESTRQKRNTERHSVNDRKNNNKEEEDIYEDKYPYQDDTGFLTGISYELDHIEEYGTPLRDDEQYDSDGYEDESYEADEYDDERYDSDGYEDESYEKDEYDDEQYGSDEYEDESYETDEYDDERYDSDGYEDESYEVDGYGEEDFEEEDYIREDAQDELYEFEEDLYEKDSDIEDDDTEESYAEDDYAEEESYAEGDYAEEESYAEDNYAEEESYAEDDYAEEESYVEDDYAEDESYDEEESAWEDYAEEDDYDEEDSYAEDDSVEEAYVEHLGIDDDSYASDDMDFYDYEEEEDEDSFEEYDEEEDDYYEEDDSLEDMGYVPLDEEYIPPVVYDDDDRFADKEPIPLIFAKKIAGVVKKMSVMDMILAATAVIILIIGICTLTSFVISKNIKKQVEALAPVGEELSQMGVVGESGLLALADNVKAAQNAETVVSEEETTEEAEENADDVKVSFTSVEKDLKIKFTYGTTGNLVTGVTFEVELTNSKGKTTTLRDEDQDGIIYEKDMAAGTYEAVIKSVGDFVFPETSQKVTVKDKIEYVVINVQDEIKSESQVNVAAEDTAQVNAAAEAEQSAAPTVKDTVEWVESTKTAKDGKEEYSKISKDSITDPSLTSMRVNAMKLAGVDVSLDKSSETIYTGGTLTLSGSTYSNSDNGTEKVTYSYEWTSSNNDVATVSNGTVTGKKAGSVTITYKVTRKVVKNEEVSEEKTKRISVEEYEKLSDEEKKKCKPIEEEVTEEVEVEPTSEASTEDGETDNSKKTETKTYKKVVGYEYTYTEKKDNSSEYTEEGSASCQITVKDIAVTSATLSLDKTEVTVNEKATVTVAPAKLEYKYSNGKTETKTSGYPAITWESADKAIATVDGKGTITGQKAGSTTVKATISGIKDESGKDISVTATCKVTVKTTASLSLTLDQTKASVAVGKTITLKPTVQNYASDSGVTWSTSDEKIAKVNDKGEVTGVKVGSVTITATTKEKSAANNEKVTATCTVTVTSDVTKDTTTLLKDKDGNQVYIKNSKGEYVKATYADYFTAEKFYIKNEIEYKYTGWQTIDDKTYYFDKNGNYVTGTQIIQGIEYNFTSDGVLKMNNSGSTLGIDVSKWNGTINWTAVKNSGVDFAIIRCGYRGSSTGALIEDPMFKKNIQGAKAAGIKVGIYFFTQAVNEVEAVEEASMAISLAKNYGLTYPIFIDTEGSGGRADGISKDARTAAVNAFCRTVANAGYKAGIYASKSWYEQKLHTSSLNSYKIWLAQYASKPTYGGRYDMWQYSSKGTVGGISGKVDMNISYLGY